MVITLWISIVQEQGWSSNLTVVRICNLDIDRNFSGVCVSPSVSFADSSLIRGSPACRKSLAEFRARRRERHADHFSRRRVRREKYAPACKCAGCPQNADSSCAQQAAACCRKTPLEFFDSLRPPSGKTAACCNQIHLPLVRYSCA